MEMQSERRALDKIYKRRDRYEIPEWQRDEVWPLEKKRLLIDSILSGWKLPKFYLAKTSDDPEEFEVVDGQQRLATIFEFFGDSLTLSPALAEKHGGSRYSDLPDAAVDQFDDYEIEYDLITEHTEKELKEFFQRLQGGLQLTSSEKLNAVHSNLTDFVRKLARHRFFKNKVSIRDTRMAHFDIVSKVAALQVDGIETGLRYEELKATFESAAAFHQTRTSLDCCEPPSTTSIESFLRRARSSGIGPPFSPSRRSLPSSSSRARAREPNLSSESLWKRSPESSLVRSSSGMPPPTSTTWISRRLYRRI